MFAKKVLFLVTEDWYFWSHRRSLAKALQQRGFQVTVATQVNQYQTQILAEGFRLIPIQMKRNRPTILQEIKALLELIKIYRAERPDIVHHIAIKPIVYGSLAACFVRVPLRINTLAGLGTVFSATTLKAKLAQGLILIAFKILLSGWRTRVIVQNPDDAEVLRKRAKLKTSQIKLIRGSGVDCDKFSPIPEPDGIPLVVMASRLLWQKGVLAFVEAAQQLQAEGVQARFILVGESDLANSGAVPTQQLQAWHDNKIIEWWGHRTDMPAILSQAQIVCLPSAYGEGVPKVLIEAAACARPIVTTDTPGCREIVKHGQNGLLVPVRNPIQLAAAIKQLLLDKPMRLAMGERGRAMVMASFSEKVIIEETLLVYEELLK